MSATKYMITFTYKKKEVTELKFKKRNSNLKDKNGDLIMDIEDKLRIYGRTFWGWIDLYSWHTRKYNKTANNIREVEKSIQLSKDKKVNGPDEITTEHFKL